LIIQGLAANCVQAEGVAVERTVRVVRIVRDDREPVLASSQVNAKGVVTNLVLILNKAKTVTAGWRLRKVRSSCRAGGDQVSAVAFGYATADFQIAAARVQAAQVVGKEAIDRDLRVSDVEVLKGGRAVGAAADDGVVLVRQAVSVPVVRIEI